MITFSAKIKLMKLSESKLILCSLSLGFSADLKTAETMYSLPIVKSKSPFKFDTTVVFSTALASSVMLRHSNFEPFGIRAY